MQLKDMGPLYGRRVRQELDRRYGPDHGITFGWGVEEGKPESWDDDYCPWDTMRNLERKIAGNCDQHNQN